MHGTSRTRLALGAAIVVIVAIACGARAWAGHKVRNDFLRYHRGGRLVATGRADLLYDREYLAGQHVYEAERAEERAQEGTRANDYLEESFKYLPATAVMLAPIGLLPPRVGWVLWSAWNGGLIALMFFALHERFGRGRSAWWIAVPIVVLARAAIDNVNLGQLNPSSIVPATLAVLALEKRRDATAGVLAGFGTVVKFMPVLLLLWFAWKRRPRALVAMLLAIALIGGALPAIALGPGRAADLARTYFSARSPDFTRSDPEDVTGHSIRAFAFRVFSDVDFRRVRTDPEKRVELDVSVARLPGPILRALVLALDLLVLGLVLFRTRGPLREVADPRSGLEAAAFLTTFVLVSPEARSPHFLVLALPMVVVTYELLRRRAAGEAWRAAASLSIAAAVLLQCTTSWLGTSLANWLTAVCVLGWAALLLLVALLRLLRPARDGMDPEAPSNVTGR